jgi:hypothetical protein
MSIDRTPKGPPRSVFLPYPELVEACPHDGPWKIADSADQDWLPSNGATNKLAKELYVPLEPGGEGVTTHELAHVRWSPERLPRVRFPLILLQAVEDARINLGLERIGLPVELDREGLAHVAHLAASDAKRGDVAATVVRAIAALGTDAESTLREELSALPGHTAELAMGWVDDVGARLERARERVAESVAPFRVARQIARDLARELDRHGLLRDDLRVPGVGCCQVVAHADDRRGRRGTATGAAKRLAYERRLARGRGDAGGIAVGRMRISCPPLIVRQPSVLSAGLCRRRVATEGTFIRRPDRLAIDRAIFQRSGRGGGGTILVDTSGSMCFDTEQIEQIVRAAGGAAVVAIYSGSDVEGELRIVARGDLRVSSELLQPFGSGNIVDLPALEWLAKQPEPRLWLSDGCVTGVGDAGCEKLRARCRELAKRARIQRVDTASEVVEALEAR